MIGLLIPHLANEWNIGIYENSLLITIIYLGVAAGAYLETFSDKYGRYRFVIIDAILQLFFGLASALCSSFYTFLFCRFFYGVSIGLIVPIAMSFLTEITPNEQRCQTLLIGNVVWAVGSLTTCLLSWLLLQSQHWRILLALLCIPGAFALYFQNKNGRESLRYLWQKK